jgi:hypothetical protein
MHVREHRGCACEATQSEKIIKNQENMEKEEKKIYMKPSTEIIFVESTQYHLNITTNEGDHKPGTGGGVIGSEEAKPFDLWDEDPEALYGNPSIWDE